MASKPDPWRFIKQAPFSFHRLTSMEGASAADYCPLGIWCTTTQCQAGCCGFPLEKYCLAYSPIDCIITCGDVCDICGTGTVPTAYSAIAAICEPVASLNLEGDWDGHTPVFQ